MPIQNVFVLDKKGVLLGIYATRERAERDAAFAVKAGGLSAKDMVITEHVIEG